MAHFAKYMMFKTLVASRRYASELTYWDHILFEVAFEFT